MREVYWKRLQFTRRYLNSTLWCAKWRLLFRFSGNNVGYSSQCATLGYIKLINIPDMQDIRDEFLRHSRITEILKLHFFLWAAITTSDRTFPTQWRVLCGSYRAQPTPCSRNIFEKLIIAQLPQLKLSLAWYVCFASCCLSHCYVYLSFYHNTKQLKTWVLSMKSLFIH
jgi:hypothetical protein